MRLNKLKLFSLTLTVVIIASLILSGPAQAFILNLSIPSPNIDKGNPFSFVISAQPESNEVIVPSSFNLEIIGAKNVSCILDAQGKIIKGCQFLKISKLDIPGYGYGYDSSYGYGYGFLPPNAFLFNVTLNTKQFPQGVYSLRLTSSTNKGEFSTTSSFSIISPLNGCSMRAKDGVFIINDSVFSTKNKLNFYIPLKGAAKGDGYITAQSGRKTFSYKFKVDKIIDNNATTAIISVNGKYQLDTKKNQEASALVYYNKLQNTVNIVSDSFTIKSLSINFKSKC